MSWQLLALDVYLRMVERPFLAREDDFVRGRARMVREAKLFVMPKGVRWHEAPLVAEGTQIRALRMEGPEGGPVLLWIHGGAYIIGAPETHAAMARRSRSRSAPARCCPTTGSRRSIPSRRRSRT
jgi:epsilon-lactone hydrolase